MKTRTYVLAVAILLTPPVRAIGQTTIESLLDSSFTPNVEGTVSAFAVQPDDKLVIVTQPENSDSFVTRLNPNGTTDAGFRVYPIPRNTAFTYSSVVTLQADGKILITGPECLDGLCEPFGAAFITRLNADGTVDATFQRGLFSSKTNECRPFVSTIATTEQGIYAAGTFTEFDGVDRTVVVRLNRDGTLDPGFEYHLTPGVSGCRVRVDSMIVDSNGKLIIAGFLWDSTGAFMSVARLNDNGSLDKVFDQTAICCGSVNAVARQADGGLLVAGAFRRQGDAIHHNLVRFNERGLVDESFRPIITGWGNLLTEISSLVQQPDGNIIVAGWSLSAVNGVRRDGIARLRPDGSLDSSFHPGEATYSGINRLGLQSDGKVIALGDGAWDRREVHGLFRFRSGLTNRWVNVAQTNYFSSESEGQAEMTFERIGDTNGIVTIDYRTCPITAIAGRDYLEEAGTLSFAPGEVQKRISIAFLDNTFVEGDRTLSIALKHPSPGSVLGTRPTALLNILDDDRPGSLDLSFDAQPGATLYVETELSLVPWLAGGGAIGGFYGPLDVQPDFKVWVSGRCCLGARFAGRLNPDGLLDSTIGAVDTDTLGLFLSDSTRVARVNPDGSLSEILDRAPELQEETSAVALRENDGKILLASATGDGYTLSRLNENGSIDPSFPPLRLNGPVQRMALQPDGKLLIAGRFNEVNGITRLNLARINLHAPFKFAPLIPPPKGELKLKLTTEPGKTYILQTSTNLLDWLPLSTNSATTFSFDISDPDARQHLKRFYRARIQ